MKKIMAFLMTAVMVCSMGTTAFAATAKASADKVAVNGQEVKMQAYNIDGYNYFKLRDVAQVMNGTPATFQVGWDAEKQLIVLEPGSPYVGSSDVGKAAVTGTKTANPGNGDVLVGGKVVHLSAYNIDGYNYFKLRDLGEAAGFEVGWDEARKCVNILSYSNEPPVVPAVPETKPADDMNLMTDLENKVINSNYGLDVYSGEKHQFKNCVFNGEVFVMYNCSGEDGETVTFTDCTFNQNLVVAGLILDEMVQLNNCTFAPGYGRYFAE